MRSFLRIGIVVLVVSVAAPGPQKFYKEWKMDDLLPGVTDLGTGHDWNQGRELFRKAACGVCHAFGSESEGTGLAPDLTDVASAYTREFILQSILEPSATINGRFFHTKFTVDIVAKADRVKQGSWISITEDDQGRLILGANEQQPFTRLTLDKAGKVTKTETIFTPVSEAMGVTWHDNSLYVQGGRLDKPFTETMDSPGFGRQSGQAGLHRLRDPKGDGSFTTIDTLRTWDGHEGGHSDHGIHEARVSPDGKHFYIINGNGVVPPPDVSPDSPLRNYADDRIIPLLGQQTGRLGHEKAPGGYIARTTFDAKDLHLFSGGMRNALHFDWNGDGEIFSFDSDMEPEFGVPWYRPVRVFWMPSAADLGYRGNSGKYPTWYEDSLPPLVEIGLGSPVGVTFGYRTAFPAKYQKALYVADNNYGRIIAVHLKAAGSGYVATSWENFIWPKSLYGATPRMPHNVTDMIVARDGTFYYVIGNRRTQSYLMKATYVGNQPTARVDYRNTDGAQDRALRRSLEAFHWTRNDPKAVAAAWPHLGSEDRFLRFAARVAVETVSPDAWKARALAEQDAATAIIAMLALARVGGPSANEELFAALSRFPLSTLSDPLRIQKLRVIEVAVSRNGRPSDAAIQKIIADVDSVFPGSSFELNTEMSQILAAFNAETVVEKTLRLMAQSKIYEESRQAIPAWEESDDPRKPSNRHGRSIGRDRMDGCQGPDLGTKLRSRRECTFGRNDDRMCTWLRAGVGGTWPQPELDSHADLYVQLQWHLTLFITQGRRMD